jgi:hypothetical protein
MKKTQILFLVAALVVMALAITPEIAQATPVIGNIAFAGNGSPTGGTGNWTSATGVHFLGAWATSVPGSGDYSTIPQFTNPVTFTDGTWGAGSGNVSQPTTITWTLLFNGSTYTLTTTTATNIDRGAGGNDNISVVGTGTLSISGLITREATPGSWSYTAGFNSTGAQNLSFSSGAVPEPTTVLMFGSGLIALILAKRLKKI